MAEQQRIRLHGIDGCAYSGEIRLRRIALQGGIVGDMHDVRPADGKRVRFPGHCAGAGKDGMHLAVAASKKPRCA
ncbi:hypothetical protein GCM10010918_20430 [Paenibacillus radicis (ex Gao et al. 2016)]|uniref:Uncharacterized protein n=1 Tax=Paenibacillus radicis (ex Gao et al. 2016) TaxID=1737354 RepID=A0A917LZI9_9BACL|nr:hypothetical protein GCM10010918_20430 [Paenibacillus radicis (ex Gao et al. 2016)]